VTRPIELDRLARGAEARDFAEAVRNGRDARVGDDGFTASGGHKQEAPIRPALGADRFTASGDSKSIAGSRPKLGGDDFTASGDGKPTQICGDDFVASGTIKDV
jgi:hypothetical protein